MSVYSLHLWLKIELYLSLTNMTYNLMNKNTT